MRATVTVKGSLEKYVQEQVEETGLSAPMIIVQLAMAGMEYKQGLKSFATLAAALEGQEQAKKEKDIEE